MLILLLAATLTWLLWRLLRTKSYWSRREVPAAGGTPWGLSSLAPGLPQVCRLYRSTASPVIGFFKGWRPVLLVRDPELVVAVMQAASNHFADKRHPVQLDISKDPLSQHLFGLTGEKWKLVRSKLTPVFSSGKIKESLPLMEEAVEELLAQLGTDPVDVYPVAVTLVTDVILSYAFGLSREDPNRAEVRKMGLRSIEVTSWIAFKRAIRFCFPNLFRLLGLRAFDPEVTTFFTNFVREAASPVAKSNKTSRGDFISRLGDVAAIVPDNERYGLMAAQVFSFYVAGFETTCFALATCLYELSKNPNVFAKARGEVDGLLKNHGKFHYEALQEASYITQVIQESMRLYPPDYATPRVCTKTYQLPGTEIIIEKGTEVLIPGFCLSRDPQYYKDPLKFDPERFSKENKSNIVPGTYFPFGDGPRKCIAVRFSMLELKYVVARLIAEYDLELDPSIPTQLSFDNRSRVTHYTGRIFIKFKKRVVPSSLAISDSD